MSTPKIRDYVSTLRLAKCWVTNIDLESEAGILSLQKIMMDYDKLPIRCRVRLSWKHKASECNEYKKDQ